MTEELKPCPFCGGTRIEIFNDMGRTYYVECQNCGVSLPSNYLTEAKAIAAWNSRDPGVAIRTIVDAVVDGVLERRNGSS